MDIKFDSYSGDFATNFKNDIPNSSDHVLMNLAHRLDTMKGEHFYWTEYGTEISKAIGIPNSPDTHVQIINSVYDACIQDTRIEQDSVTVDLTSLLDSVEVKVLVADASITIEV